MTAEVAFWANHHQAHLMNKMEEAPITIQGNTALEILNNTMGFVRHHRSWLKSVGAGVL